MKRLLFLIFLFPFILRAQTDTVNTFVFPGIQDSIPGTSLILKNNILLFQKVYSSALNKEELASALRSFLPTVNSFELSDVTNQTTYQLKGKISNYFVNFLKYGDGYRGVAYLIYFPLNADVLIQIKDKKYRVTISNLIVQQYYESSIINKDNAALESFLTKDDRSKIQKSNKLMKTAQYINYELTTSFDLNSTAKVTDDF
ncbi:hypothetical protein [Pedobacter cryoconitis]|uniref:DUF4468 domain-containing protein n=1 Tax=Pedobacter cryoconitis TaxID=188932 RepID=A0A327TCW9_9SPHI|nr:hypothetical protein [Pedobacter cryoconitis]RAJ35687.1 hypothetical protein LY11_00933 [Pedobacter cryoconitis]